MCVVSVSSRGRWLNTCGYVQGVSVVSSVNRSINSPEPSTGFYVRSREHVVSGDRWDGVLLFLKKDTSFLRPALGDRMLARFDFDENICEGDRSTF